MRYHLLKIRHQLCSNNRHGTHSPFVYQLADRAIYRKEGELAQDKSAQYSPISSLQNPQKEAVIRRILAYLGVQTICFATAPASPYPIEGGGERNPDEAEFEQAIWIPQDEMPDLESFQQPVLYILDEPHRTAERHQYWQKMQALDSLTWTIDLFHFGLMIFRKGQQKQDFKLKFPRF